ncbi:cytochrome c oxidase subunit NDUFA4 isoform X1 [Oryctolagus cuniculus]|uniref:cytochrome c oxidase subunit NDUFA4 isoform X1 n=1 Tax=Oryctolagus cuniculus TaxID=9986 RepID=UPI00387A13E9
MLRQIIGQAKKHPSLIPLFIFIGAGGTGAALYVMRLALFNPDVSWDRKNNPEPWNKLGPNDQYKVSYCCYRIVGKCVAINIYVVFFSGNWIYK